MDNLNEVVEKIKTNVNSGIISSENDAIQYLIQPFLTLLGYDFSNPSQVRREEYVETLKDRVDFILTTSSGLKIAVEAENADVDLTKGTSGDAQARRYFNNGLDFKLSISTNGLVYNFFADIEANNHADERPFYSFDIRKINDEDKNFIDSISRVNLNENLLNDIKDKFRDQSLIEKVGKYIDKLLKNPNDDFARLIARQFESGFITTGVKERYKEAIVQSQKEKSTIVDPKVNAISQTSTTGDETLATKDIPKPSTNTDKKYNKKQHYIVLSNGVKIGPDKGSVIYGNFFRYLYTTFPEQLKKYVIQGVPSGSKEQQIGTKHPWGPDFGPHTGRGMNSFIDDNMYVNVSRSNNSALASIKFFAEEFGLSVVETNLKSAVKDENGHLKNSD